MVVSDLISPTACNWGNLNNSRESYKVHGLVLFRKFLSRDDLLKLIQSISDLDDEGARKDFLMPQSNNSPRNMTVRGGGIMSNSHAIMSFYQNSEMLLRISEITEEKVVECPEQIENVITTKLSKVGDQHGLHIDDYPIAFVICLEAPELGHGGELQLLNENLINTIHLNPGDAYLMRSDQIPHRVTPLKIRSNRTILNFTYSFENLAITPNGSAYNLCN